jgi:hypothetical protein
VSVAQGIWLALFVGSTVSALFILKSTVIPAAVRPVLPIVCVLLGIGYLRVMMRDFRTSADELARRINVEAAVGACLALYICMMVYPVFKNAGMVGELDSAVVLLLLVGFYVIGFVVARRRYR